MITSGQADGTPQYTIAICTRNRADLLGESIRAAALQQTGGAGFEVLVVDNGSTDNTREVICRAMESYAMLRGVHEARAGLSIARNRALREAAGGVVVFVDDDALMEPGYIAVLHELWLERSPAAAGGPIQVKYLDPEPAWWEPAFASFCGHFDLGPEIRDLRFSQYPQGANLAVDREAAVATGGFNERLGAGPRGPWAGEEIELCARLERAGGRICYHPGMRVIHQVARAGRTRGWLLRMAYYRGRSHFHSTRAFYPDIRWRAFPRTYLAEIASSFPWCSLEQQVKFMIAAGMFVEATGKMMISR